jgi:uncharacterized protein YbjT (DUF2867 family)
VDDLVTFLQERLDEDEKVARAVPADLGHDWCDPGPWVMAGNGGGGREAEVAKAAPGLDMPLAEHVTHHIARHDPARALAEVDAKRQILDTVVPRMNEMDDQLESEYGTPGEPQPYESLTLLRLLALPYADHPAYREEWKP